MVVVKPYDLTYLEASEITLEHERRLPRADITRTVSYSNCLSMDVQMTMRDGKPYTIPQNARAKGRAFIATVTYNISGHVHLDEIPNLAIGSQDREIEMIENSLNACEANAQRYAPMGVKDKTFTLEYRVTEDAILANGGIVYVPEIDVVLSIDPNVEANHPYAAVSAPWKIIENELANDAIERFNYSIYIVSNNNAISDRYINIHNNVYRVPVIQNKSLRNGVYLCSSSPLENSTIGSPLPKIKAFYTYEEGETALRLFKTVEEARINGDEDHKRAQEVKELTLELKRADRKHKEDMAELERKLREAELERQAERNAMEDRYERRKYERKDHYEERTHSRKDTSEIFKYLTVFLSAVLTALGLVQKFNAK